MVNRQKIITMTKLALYDKHEGAADRAANDYFRHDYIYRKNLGTRISIGIAGLMILALYWMRVVFVEEIDIFEINIRHHAFESIVFLVALVAVYSLIGTVQGTREYYLVQKRLQQYQGMLRFLENTDERKIAPAEAEEEPEPAPPPERPRYGARENTNLVRNEIKTSEAKNDDILANVTTRAMAGSRPRPPLVRKPPPVVRTLTNPKETPLLRTPQEPTD